MEIKLAILTNPPSPATDYYRGVSAFKYLDGAALENGDTLRIINIHPDELASGTSWYKLDCIDAMLIQRPNGPQLGLIHELKRKGLNKIVIADIDDHLLHLPKGNPARAHFNNPSTQQSVIQSLGIVDAVIFSTNHLYNIYAPHCPQAATTVIKNALDDVRYQLDYETPTSHPVRFTWRGSATHLMDIYDIKNVFTYLRMNPQTDICYYGYEPPFDPSETGYIYRPWAGSFFAYLNQLQADQPDWMIVPLQHNDFNLGKSNIAWIEATMAGAAVLAPAGMPEWENEGILNYESEAHLKELIDDITNSDIDKASYVHAAQEIIKEDYILHKKNKSRLDFLNAVLFKGLGGASSEAPLFKLTAQ